MSSVCILGAKSQTSLLQNVLSGQEQGKTAVLAGEELDKKKVFL